MLVYVSLRADLGIKALLSGDIDYSYSVGTIIRGAILGVPVRNLTFDFSRVLHALMSRPEIPNAAALRGKRVGVSSFGATGDLAARVGLRSLGLDPEKDVTIVTLGTDTLRHAALMAGTVQATHMPVPLNIQLKKEGYHELVYAGKILQRPLTGLATSVEKIQKNPGQVQRMVRAFVRATRALKAERAGFIAFAQKKYGYSERCRGRSLQVYGRRPVPRWLRRRQLAASGHRRSQVPGKNHQTDPADRCGRLQFSAHGFEEIARTAP